MYQRDDLDRYLKDASQHRLLTPYEEKELARQHHDEHNEEAVHTLAVHNLRLVIKLAGRYSHNCGLPLADRIAEGNIGLLKAANRFHYKWNTRFSTYAIFWIRQAIQRAIPDGRTIRLPGNRHRQLREMKAKIADLSQTLQREPETEEICEALCISAEEYAQLTMMNFQTVSLNTPMGEGEDQTIQDILEDTTTEANAQKTLQNDLLNYIVDCLDSLTPRERMVLTHRYGLDGCFAKTLEEVGEKLSITREGVRQIERKALKKVRTLIQRDHLKI